VLAAVIHDEQNRRWGEPATKKVSLSDVPLRFSFNFAPAPLTPGVYRIDVLWNGQSAWRTFIRISD
jgi:hypothetical protein